MVLRSAFPTTASCSGLRSAPARIVASCRAMADEPLLFDRAMKVLSAIQPDDGTKKTSSVDVDAEFGAVCSARETCEASANAATTTNANVRTGAVLMF